MSKQAAPSTPAPAAPAAAAEPGKPAQPAASAPPPADPAAPKPGATPPADPAAPPKPPADPLAPRFAALSREEKRIREERAEFDRKMKAGEYVTPAQIKEQIEADPVGFLKKHGSSYQAVTQKILGDRKTPEQLVQELQARIDKQEKDARDKEEKQLQDARDRAISAEVGEIDEHLKASGEKYEFTKVHPQGAQLVFNVQVEYFNKHQKQLSRDEAAELVEKSLEDEHEKTIFSTTKAKKRFEPKAPEPPTGGDPGKSATPPAAAEPPKGLNNGLNGAAPTPPGKMLSDEDSRREAAKHIRWTK